MSISIRENEKIIKLLRQHVIFVLPTILLWLLIIYGTSYIHWKAMLLTALIGLIVVVRKIVSWRRTVLLVSNERIVCHIQKGFFSSTVVELLISDIEEISYEKQGILASVFGYGDLHLRTPSETTHVFEGIPHPEMVSQAMHSLRK